VSYLQGATYEEWMQSAARDLMIDVRQNLETKVLRRILVSNEGLEEKKWPCERCCDATVCVKFCN